VFLGALVRLIVTADAALLQATASEEIVRGCDCRCTGCGHGSADAWVALRVPLRDFEVELGVEHVGFEAESYVVFTAERT
jgi:hypothetical protein